jgi:hypothetical protein
MQIMILVTFLVRQVEEETQVVLVVFALQITQKEEGLLRQEMLSRKEIVSILIM